MTSKAPRPPAGTGKAGAALWRGVLDSYELQPHELLLLRQAVAVADVCDDLHARVQTDGTLLDGRAHPALVELRQQRVLLARLLVALRVPLGEQEAERTQYRGLRGVYAVRGGAA